MIGSSVCFGESRPSAVGSDGGQPSSSPWPFSRSEAQANRFVERLYPLTPGRFGRDGLVHGGGPDAQLLTYYVLFFIHLETRRVKLAGFTPYPDQGWMEQQARNLTMEQWGCLRGCRYLLHDRDTKFCESFRELIESGSVKPLRLPARSPNLNSYAERWVRSVKEECLAKFILVGESSLRRAAAIFAALPSRAEPSGQGK